MAFDEHLKDLARAHDAVDRLRDINADLEKQRLEQELRQDLTRRLFVLVIIASLVGYAYLKL
jgi:hypothetical protein